MNAEALEAAIVKEIEALGIPAGLYPQKPGEYIPAAYPGEVLVRYTGTTYAAADVSSARKERTQVVEIVVVSQELRGEAGAYTWLDRIRMALEGLVLLNTAGTLRLEAEEFLDEYGGTWQFGQKWNLTTNYIYEYQDDYAERSLSTSH
ncbi:MAG: Gp37 family protein [Culturomica sp.]|jgi:hypothetical protein|nr:Gp37 family protein [Culturomica sp.]